MWTVGCLTLIRSDDPGILVYNLWCGFRVIQVCSFISSLDTCSVIYSFVWYPSMFFIVLPSSFGYR
jgi:hypothetical protein